MSAKTTHLRCLKNNLLCCQVADRSNTYSACYQYAHRIPTIMIYYTIGEFLSRYICCHISQKYQSKIVNNLLSAGDSTMFGLIAILPLFLYFTVISLSLHSTVKSSLMQLFSLYSKLKPSSPK